MNPFTVAGIQMGAYAGDYETNMNNAVEALNRLMQTADPKPSLVCFSEMMTTPYFACVYDKVWLDQAETIPGRTTDILLKSSKEHGIHIIGTTTEVADGKYYNSAFLLSPEGLKGLYRKVQIPRSGNRNILPIDEQYYFQAGDRLPVFDVNGITIGILLCFDRSFPENFRILMLQGAKVVFVPVATFGMRKDSFWDELKVRAMENHIFIVAANKAAQESCAGEEQTRSHFGRSCAIGPLGNMMVSLEDESFGSFVCTLDLDDVEHANSLVNWAEARSPHLYGKLVE